MGGRAARRRARWAAPSWPSVRPTSPLLSGASPPRSDQRLRAAESAPLLGQRGRMAAPATPAGVAEGWVACMGWSTYVEGFAHRSTRVQEVQPSIQTGCEPFAVERLIPSSGCAHRRPELTGTRLGAAHAALAPSPRTRHAHEQRVRGRHRAARQRGSELQTCPPLDEYGCLRPAGLDLSYHKVPGAEADERARPARRPIRLRPRDVLAKTSWHADRLPTHQGS